MTLNHIDQKPYCCYFYNLIKTVSMRFEKSYFYLFCFTRDGACDDIQHCGVPPLLKHD